MQAYYESLNATTAPSSPFQNFRQIPETAFQEPSFNSATLQAVPAATGTSTGVPGTMIANPPPHTNGNETIGGETVLTKPPGPTDKPVKPVKANREEAAPEEPPKGRVVTQDNQWYNEVDQCLREAETAASDCISSHDHARRAQDNVNQQSANLSNRTAVACQQMSSAARDAASSVSAWGNSCQQKVAACRASCAFVRRRIKSSDINYFTAVQAYQRCESANGSHGSIVGMASDVGRLASNFNDCYTAVGGNPTAQPNLNIPNQQTPNYQQQQQAQQQLNCAVNPRGCGQQQTEPFAPTNMQPAAIGRDSGADRLPTVAGPGNVTIPFDGAALMKDDGRPRSRGADTPARGSPKANMSDFSNRQEPAKPKRYQSTAEKVGAEVYRGYMSPAGDGSSGGQRIATSDLKPLQPIKPIVGTKIAPLGGSFAKFSGKAQELRQIWSQKLRESSSNQRGIAGSEYRGLIPTGADGLTGPHTENFKKIRGRYLYLERSLNY